MHERVSMIGATESVEKAPLSWEELRKNAVADADALLASIPEFGTLSRLEQMATLQEEIDSLASDNAHRYLARELSIRRARLVATHEYEALMHRLGVQVETSEVR